MIPKLQLWQKILLGIFVTLSIIIQFFRIDQFSVFIVQIISYSCMLAIIIPKAIKNVRRVFGEEKEVPQEILDQQGKRQIITGIVCLIFAAIFLTGGIINFRQPILGYSGGEIITGPFSTAMSILLIVFGISFIYLGAISLSPELKRYIVKNYQKYKLFGQTLIIVVSIALLNLIISLFYVKG